MNTAAVLVGGKGTRLQSLVSDVPKPLANVAGEPFLFIILRALRCAGITHVVLLTGYMQDKIVKACGDGQQFDLQITYSQEHQALGTAGALKNAQQNLLGCEEFLLLNGDTYLDCSLDGIVNYPLGKTIYGVLGVCEPDDAKRYGSIVLAKNSNQIISFREKDSSANIQPLVSAGIYKLSEKILQCIPENKNCSLETEIFPFLLEHQHPLHAVKLAGDFCDIGVPDSYAGFSLKRMLSSKTFDPIARAFFSLFLMDEPLWTNHLIHSNVLVNFLKEEL